MLGGHEFGSIPNGTAMTVKYRGKLHSLVCEHLSSKTQQVTQLPPPLSDCVGKQMDALCPWEGRSPRHRGAIWSLCLLLSPRVLQLLVVRSCCTTDT